MSNESMNPDRDTERVVRPPKPATEGVVRLPKPVRAPAPGFTSSKTPSKPMRAPESSVPSAKTGPIQKPSTPKGVSSQAGLAGVRMGASMSGMRPGMAPKVAPAKPRPTRGLVQRTHDPFAPRPINKGPQPDPDIIDRVPSQEELVAREQAARGVESKGFEAQEGETTAGATARGFSEGLAAAAGPAGGMMARGAGEAQEPSGASVGNGSGGAAIEDRLEKRPWLKDIVDQSDVSEQGSLQQGEELER